MTRTRMASAATVLLLACAALLGPAASAQTPAPSPSGTPAASPSGSTAPASPSPSAARDRVALLLSAEPDTIALGEDTVLVAQVTNTGTATSAATLTVTLPAQLELTASFPQPSASRGTTHSFELGPLDPGESAVAQVTATGTAAVTDGLVTATAAAGSATTDAATTVTVVERGGEGALAVSSRTSRVLTQVGSMLHYEVTVTNEGDDDLENVLVVDVAPAEVDVFSVDIVDEVEAVQIGESGGRHDIVWNVGSLPAGASVELPWDGRAARAGDLEAVNSVRGLVGTTETTRAVSRSFLAAERERTVENPPFDPIEKRVVTFEAPPPGSPAASTTTQPGAVLPFTGADPARIVRAGLLLLLGGVLLLAGTRLAREPRKALVAAALAGVLGVACVSGSSEDPQGAAPQTSPGTIVTDDPRDDEDTKVKGERIVRGEDDEDATPAPTAPPAASPPASPPPPATLPPSATPPPALAAPATAPPATAPADATPVRTVTVVRTELEDLPVADLASRPGDNSISFGWDEAAGGITYATSGIRIGAGGASSLTTDMSAAGGSLSNLMTLRNTAEAARLRVHGRLVHEVYDGSRLVARLRSEPIDVVLSPGGELVARFSYLLPAGDYSVEAAFESAR